MFVGRQLKIRGQLVEQYIINLDPDNIQPCLKLVNADKPYISIKISGLMFLSKVSIANFVSFSLPLSTFFKRGTRFQ